MQTSLPVNQSFTKRNWLPLLLFHRVQRLELLNYWDVFMIYYMIKWIINYNMVKWIIKTIITVLIKHKNSTIILWTIKDAGQCKRCSLAQHIKWVNDKNMKHSIETRYTEVVLIKFLKHDLKSIKTSSLARYYIGRCRNFHKGAN